MCVCVCVSSEKVEGGEATVATALRWLGSALSLGRSDLFTLVIMTA